MLYLIYVIKYKYRKLVEFFLIRSYLLLLYVYVDMNYGKRNADIRGNIQTTCQIATE